MNRASRSLPLALLWTATVAAAAPSAAVLDLPGGGFLTGRLAERPAAAEPFTTLPWQSPLFEEPIEFRIEAIGRVRFPRAGSVPAGAGWRCEFDGGDFLLGEIGGLDGEHLTFRPTDVGVQELRIRRAAVARLMRLDAGTIVVVPGGIEAWRTAPGWSGDGGRLATRARGSFAYRPIDAPRRACYDIALSWETTPEFELFVAADERAGRSGGQPTVIDTFRIESVGATLLAVRERDKAVADAIAELPQDARGLRLLVFVDRDRGRMAVVLPGGANAAAKVFDATLPPKAAPAGGVLVRLRSGDLRIDDLRVTEWRDQEPRTAVEAAPFAESYAAAAFTIREGKAQRQLPAAEATVLAVREAGAAPLAVPPEAVRAVFQGGSRISGRLRAIAGAAVVIASPALADDLACPFERLAMLEAAVPRDPPAGPGRDGILEAVLGRSAGCLANAAAGDGLAWMPRGAVAPVRVQPAVESLRIVYDGAGKAGDKPAAAGPAVAYLRNGDSIPCAVLAGSAEGVRVRTAVAADVPVPAAALRAVELVPSDPLGVPREKLARLLTLPRMQKADPPTHMLRLQAGDYVRGKLLSLDDARVRFEVLGAVKEFPRDQVTRLIWLTQEGDQPPAEPVPEAADGLPVQGVMRDKRRLTVRARKVVGDQLVGRHAVLGEAGIDLAACDRLLVGGAIAETPAGDRPYAQWVLKPAEVPRILKSAAPSPPAAGDAPAPAAGAPAAPAATAEELAALAAAEKAALSGDRSCLETLGQLLTAGAPDVRRRAIALLRQLTGRPARDLAFRPEDPPEKSQADVFRWRQWIAREGAFAELVFPRRPDAAAPAAVRGRTLCSVPGENAVIEIDDRGRETFRVEAKSAYACDLLPDGSRLVGDGRSVIEYDPAGREVWSLPDLPREPMSVRRLDNGNTLVAFDGFDDRAGVMEYDRAGELVWKWASRGQPADAVRLSDGNTLVAMHGENVVVEIDDSGKEVWRVAVDDPLRTERLADGTTLVVSGDSKRGWIYDQDGGVVQELGALADAGVTAEGLMVLDHEGALSLRPVVGPEKPWGKLPAGAARFRSR
jgi:hypothetical protein